MYSITCKHKIFIGERLLLKLYCGKSHMKVGRIDDEREKILFSFISLVFGTFYLQYLFIISSCIHYLFILLSLKSILYRELHSTIFVLG